MAKLPLTVNEVLTTTRSVRRRLDLERPVEREVVEECLRIAQQAPSAANWQRWHFLVVTDPQKRQALADIYRRAREVPTTEPDSYATFVTEAQEKAFPRVIESADHLAENLQRVPVHVIPCVEGRPEELGPQELAALWGSILPATWSFMLAARSRGLGTAWTTIHLNLEAEAAAVLGIPYDRVTQAALIPLAYTIGDHFAPAGRDPLATMVHWDTWSP